MGKLIEKRAGASGTTGNQYPACLLAPNQVQVSDTRPE